MEIRLEGKNALVTGASSGIGQGIAVALAAAGASVGINYRSNADGAEETARRVREAGRRALVMEADVGDPAQVDDDVSPFRRRNGTDRYPGRECRSWLHAQAAP